MMLYDPDQNRSLLPPERPLLGRVLVLVGGALALMIVFFWTLYSVIKLEINVLHGVCFMGIVEFFLGYRFIGIWEEYRGRTSLKKRSLLYDKRIRRKQKDEETS